MVCLKLSNILKPFQALLGYFIAEFIPIIYIVFFEFFLVHLRIVNLGVFESIDKSLPNITNDFAMSGYDTMALVNMRHLNPDISGIASHFDTVIKSESYRNVSE